MLGVCPATFVSQGQWGKAIVYRRCALSHAQCQLLSVLDRNTKTGALSSRDKGKASGEVGAHRAGSWQSLLSDQESADGTFRPRQQDTTKECQTLLLATAFLGLPTAYVRTALARCFKNKEKAPQGCFQTKSASLPVLCGG